MTESELLSAVDGYFSAHLDSGYWLSVNEDTRAAACAMAANDVLSALPGADLARVKPGSYALKAIAEQSVYLARHYETIADGKVLTSEGVEGISASYTLIGSTFGLSSRAQTFIKRAVREEMGGTARLTRG
jgi:hypothetical protein